MKSKHIVLLSAFILSGCGTTIYPQADGTFYSTTNSSSENFAESNALKDATEHCKKMGKRIQVIKHTYSYHGTTTGNKVAGAIVGAFVGVNPAISESDNKVELRFRCR